MLKKGMGFLLLCTAGHIFAADIIVTTVDDVVKADQECSLREAIEYINKGKPEAGYNGCGGKDSTDNIILYNQEYKINQEIRISKSLYLRTQYQQTIEDDIPGKKNATIRMTGTDRIFTIQHEKPSKDEDKNQSLYVSIQEVNLQGCEAVQCKDKGGLIYNEGQLTFEQGRLINGKAKQGGAIYSAKSANSNLDPVNNIRYSLVQNNQAEQGAVIYSQHPDYNLLGSVIRNNRVTTSNGYLLYADQALDEDFIKNVSTTQISYGLTNSTVFENQGYIIRVMDGVLVNNATIILNSKGLVLDAPSQKGYIANSIVAKNGSEDCRLITTAGTYNLSNNLYGAGCSGFASQALGQTPLIASSQNEGECDSGSDGILCPFREYERYALGYFRPRLLLSYKKLSDSPIVNQGVPLSANYVVCNGLDQRQLSRVSNNELCDRGSIELIVDRSISNSIGQDIPYGQTARMTIKDSLLDGELVPASQCQALLGNPPNNQPWQTGCMRIVQTNTPSKGSLTLGDNGEVIYTPDKDWHGTDEFNLMVVVSTTRFNDSLNPYLSIPVKIYQYPTSTFPNTKVKTSGGSLAMYSLIGLASLILLRRKK